MRNAGLDAAQAGIKIARRNINNLRYADDTTLFTESKELKSLLIIEAMNWEANSMERLRGWGGKCTPFPQIKIKKFIGI